jgi:uncharacterized membrane protein YdjX (TVP38/TMEM64 family)
VTALLTFADSVRDLGPAGLAVVALAFVIGALAFVPRPLMCAAAGFVYGFAVIPLVMLAATAGASLAFLAARYALRDRFLRLIAERRALSAAVRAVDQEGFRLICLLRVASPLPGSLQSYVLGLTRVSLPHYVLGTALGTAPQIVLFVYLGATGEALMQAPDARLQSGLLVLGLMITALCVVLVTRRTRAIIAAGMAEAA